MGNQRRNRFRENYKFFTFLSTLPPQRQKSLIKGADKEILYALSEICLNIINRNVQLTEEEKKKLRPYAEQIYQLSLKKHNLNTKRRIAQKGGLIGTLLTSLLPVLLSTVISAGSSKWKK